MNKILCHIPLIQPFIHTTYFVELMLLDQDFKENINAYNGFAEMFNESYSIFSKCQAKKDLIYFAETNEKIIKQKIFLRGQFLDHKMYEAFLEGGPQSILQLTILMQKGLSSPWQLFTIVTSFLTFCLCATEMLQNYPTRVSIIFIKVHFLNLHISSFERRPLILSLSTFFFVIACLFF